MPLDRGTAEALGGPPRRGAGNSVAIRRRLHRYVTRLGRMLGALGAAWTEHRCSGKAAAVAYYTAFSLAPILVIVLAVAGILIDITTLRAALLEQVRLLIGESGAAMLADVISASTRTEHGVWASAVAFVALLIGATTAFAELKDGLDEIFGSTRPSARAGLWGTVRSRLLSFGVVLVLAFLLLVSLAVNALLAMVASRLLDVEAGWFLRALSWVATLIVVLGLFAAIYRLLPEAKLRWRDVVLGALLTATLFMVGRLAIGLYLGNSAPASAFGAAGSLAVLLLWVYYSASIFFLGAEATRLFIASRAIRDIS